jgi:small subunit ribosomal protein S17
MAAKKTTSETNETPKAPAASTGQTASRKATKTGVVVSNKMQKTVVVAVENVVKHPMYQKYIKRTSMFLAHSYASDCNIGDRVIIEESRPLSKRKRWTVREIISRAS